MLRKIRLTFAMICAQEVPHIINRDKTGWCPLETACMELNTVEEMYPVIQNFISRIRAK